MPLFKRSPYNYVEESPVPRNIPKQIEHSIKPVKPNILVPSFIVSLSQHIVSFVLRKSSRLPWIGTKNGEIRTFTVDELHILLLSLLALSIHYTRKYRKRSQSYSLYLDKLLVDSKIHNFETLAAVDHNNIKRIECFYYKNQIQMYDIDLFTRTELRAFTHQLLSQCEVLSGLTLKILETVNSMFKMKRIKELQSGYEQKLRKNNNLRNNNTAQQRLSVEKRNRENRINEYYEGEEERLDKYQSFFDEKNNEQYVHEIQEQQREITKKEIWDSYEQTKEHKETQINAVKLSSTNMNDDHKMTEEDDQTMIDPLQEKRQLLQMDMHYDHEYLVKQAENVPIQQIDFSNKNISRYNLQMTVNQMKYDIILSEQDERRTEKIRKYGVMTVIVATTVLTYWYNRYYEGKGILDGIRDTKAKLFSYF